MASAAGCGGSAQPAEPPRALSLSGSGSTLTVLELLHRNGSFGRIPLTFLEGTDSGGGIAAVAAGAVAIGAVSRAPKPGELARGLLYRPFAKDGIAFVAKGGRTSSLTRRQLLRAFAGEVTNWRELGGANLPIVLLVRDEDESVTQHLRAELFGEGFRFARNATLLSSTGDMNEALGRTPGALGFTSYGSLVSTRTGLKPLKFEGALPSVQAFERDRYPFVRKLGIVFREGPSTSAFVAEITGGDVAGGLRKLGYAPLG
ncbi:MAG: substrate-binding domain-containing protein [Gaiellaceae bacterium]